MTAAALCLLQKKLSESNNYSLKWSSLLYFTSKLGNLWSDCQVRNAEYNETIIQSGLYSRLSQTRYIAKGQGMKKENKLSHTRGVFQHGPGVYDFIHVYGWLENLTSPCILHKTRNYNNSEIRTTGKRHRKRWTRKTKRNKGSYEVHISHSHLFKSWNQYSVQNTLLIHLIWKKINMN